MGIRITMDGYPFDATEYTVDEASTPIAGNDTSGSTGTIKFTLKQPNRYLPGSQDTGWKQLVDFGPDIFIDAPVTLADSNKGFTIGSVESITTQDSSTYLVTAVTRIDQLNVYNVQAQPFIGTLAGAFEYYCGLAGLETDIFIDPAIAFRPVTLVGWNGELWYYLKMLAATQDAEVSLVSGIVLMRPIRQRVAAAGRDTARQIDTQPGRLAQAVEVYRYDSKAITSQLVYPPGGWTDEVEIITVNAGETISQVIQLQASVSSIIQPTMLSFVDRNETSASVYTIVGDDGLDVPPAMWQANGGSLSVAINPDTTSLTVTLTGATSIPTKDGAESTTFSVALASDFSGSNYSTLRIIGTGVSFTKTKTRVRTGVPASKTGTDIGVTIDIPFINTINEVYTVGTRAAKSYAGFVPQLSGSVLSVNRRGDSGDASYPTYGAVQSYLGAQIGGTPTYGQVETYYTTTLDLTTYQDVLDFWFTQVQDSFANQVFGNVSGARIFVKPKRRWFRVRTGTIQPGIINYTADDDLIHQDLQLFYNGKTYAEVQAILNGLTYKQAELMGLYDGS